MLAILLRRKRQRVAARMGTVAVAAVVTFALTSCGPGSYTISANGGTTYALYTSHNLVSGTADDVLYYLSTASSGTLHLPFALSFYGANYSDIAISTNGNIQFGVLPPGGTAAFANSCLPSTTFSSAVAMPYWDDLFFDSNDTSHGFTEGIFVNTGGTAPHRSFTVAWEGHAFSAAGALTFAEAIFQEGSQTVTYVYGLNGGASATVGVQAPNQAASRQWTCNSGSGTAVTSGMRLTFLHAN